MTFWEEALPYAKQAHAQTGILASVILAQWADETAYGGQDWSVYHNPGNVGNNVTAGQVTYTTLQEGVNAYIKTIQGPLYAGVRSAVGYGAQCIALGESPWAASHYDMTWYNNRSLPYRPGVDLLSIVQKYTLTQYDAAPDPTPTPTPPSVEEAQNMQTTDPTTNGVWVLDTADGSVWGYAVGGGEPPYLGGFNIHPDWKVNTADVAGFSATEIGGQWGYTVSVKNAVAPGYSTYTFTRDGAYAKPTA